MATGFSAKGATNDFYEAIEKPMNAQGAFEEHFFVRWAALDANGHVRNTLFSEFATHTRFRMLEAHGFSQTRFESLRFTSFQARPSVDPDLAELYTAFDSDPTPIVEFLQRLAVEYELPQPLRVLDVGCGPGRLLRPLAHLGWEVTGMEPNPDFLARARAVASESRRLGVVRGGFEDLPHDEQFDLVMGINGSFAHLVTPDDRAESIRRCYDALRPGGVLFLDLPNFLWILKNYQPPRSHTADVLGKAVTLHRRDQIDYHEATLTTTDEYEIAGASSAPVEFVHAYGIVSFAELRAHLLEAGFNEIRTYRGYDCAGPERVDGPRLLAAARRPSA